MGESTIFCVGDLVIDPDRRVVSRRGEIVPLGERGMSALLRLIEDAGSVVTKAELLDSVWPDAVVGDDSLVKAIGEIRAALGDETAQPRFVQTVHRRGYRFIAQVRREPATLGRTVAEDHGSGRRRTVIAAAVALATVVVIAIVFSMVRSGGDDAGAPFRGCRFGLLANAPEGAIKPSFAPSGDFLATVVADGSTGEHALWLLTPGSDTPLRLTTGLEVRGPSPSFSADGSRIFFTTYRHDPDRGVMPEVQEVPVLGGPTRLKLAGASALSESPDGLSVAYASVSEGGSSIVVRSRDGAERVVADHGYWPRWSPDGRWIAFTTSNPEGGDGGIEVVRPDGDGRRLLTPEASQIYGLCWTPDSRWVVFASELRSNGDLWAVSVDGAACSPITSGPGECSAPTVSADGSSLVFAHAMLAAGVYVADGIGQPSWRLLSEPVVEDVALSPDGGSLAVAVGGLAEGPAVSVVDVQSGRRQTLSGLHASRVRWTPDGEALVVVAASPDGVATWLWRLPRAGGLPTPLVRGNGRWESFDLAPDGARIAGARRSGSDCSLMVVDLASGTERQLADDATYDDIRWSPDGRWIGFTGGDRPQDTVSSGVWIVTADGGEPRRLTADGARIAWFPDSQGLLFARFEVDSGLWRVGLDGSPPERVERPREDPWHYRIEGLELGPHESPVVTHLMTESANLYVVHARD